MYDEFKHHNGGFYVYIEVPVELLYMIVPEQANNSKTDIIYDEEGNILSYRLKNVLECLTMPPIYSNYGTKCIILLNEKYSPRMNSVNESDIAFWDASLSQLGLGYNSGLWMSLDQSSCINKVSTKLNSAEYYNELDQ